MLTGEECRAHWAKETAWHACGPVESVEKADFVRVCVGGAIDDISQAGLYRPLQHAQTHFLVACCQSAVSSSHQRFHCASSAFCGSWSSPRVIWKTVVTSFIVASNSVLI